MNSKVLIFMRIDMLKPTGGPVGYLFNVHKALAKHNINNINFIQPLHYNNINIIKKLIKMIIPKKIKKLIINYKLVNSIYYNNTDINYNFNEYDAVHFHTTNALFMNRFNLKNYNGKVILMSHSPKPAHMEIIEDQLSRFEKLYYGKKLKSIKKIDKFAFSRADYIIFPCHEAKEPYEKNWTYFLEIENNNIEKFKYLPTGCNKCYAKLTEKEIRETYKIPYDAFVICYIGRHNETKGFDVLKKLGEAIINKNENIYFLIAGNEGPIKKLNHERWIEVGWTNDPHSLINACNLFLLPNKETYFDLILLEVLSLGKLLLISDTGGNKYYKKFDEKGIYYFNNINEALKLIYDIKNLEPEYVRNLELSNLKLFDEYFTMDVFLENYISLLDNIIKV
jgi:glycosyltransferase involved in cell wall biosynthesis